MDCGLLAGKYSESYLYVFFNAWILFPAFFLLVSCLLFACFHALWMIRGWVHWIVYFWTKPCHSFCGLFGVFLFNSMWYGLLGGNYTEDAHFWIRPNCLNSWMNCLSHTFCSYVHALWITSKWVQWIAHFLIETLMPYWFCGLSFLPSFCLSPCTVDY